MYFFSHSYRRLIQWALEQAPMACASCNEICQWIEVYFPFYKLAQPSWRVSNLESILTLRTLAFQIYVPRYLYLRTFTFNPNQYLTQTQKHVHCTKCTILLQKG